MDPRRLAKAIALAKISKCYAVERSHGPVETQGHCCMGRLKTTSSRLAVPQPRVGAASGDTRAQDRQRNQEKPWRTWYYTVRWKKLQRKILARAEGLCEQTGVPLLGPKGAPNSPIIDHIQKHNGDPDLFWDEQNLQAVSKKWHDTVKQRQERAEHDRS